MYLAPSSVTHHEPRQHLLNMRTVLFLVAVTTFAETAAFAGIRAGPHCSCKTALRSTVGDLGATYEAITKQVTDKLGLQSTDFTATYEADTWATTDTSGTALWLSESSPKFLTGASFNTQHSKDTLSDDKSYTINIWMGPSYDVPHMLLTFGQSTSHASSITTYSVLADYVVRGATPFGSDPQIMDNYYGDDVSSAWSQAYALPGAHPLAPQSEVSLRILNSPARIAIHQVTSLDDVNGLVHNHVDRFLSWVDKAQPIMARTRGSFNLRDDKLRQYYFKGEVAKNMARLGQSLGLKVATANTGPTAEAYVGGGS